jgi:hypothetical protein
MEIQLPLDIGSTMRHRQEVIGSTRRIQTVAIGSKTTIATQQAPGVT